jgi:hypothetical protein
LHIGWQARSWRSEQNDCHGLASRDGQMKATVIPNVKKDTLRDFVL